jgi:NADPH:quinone reductase
VGDRVVYADGPLGAYATARVYPTDRLVLIPDGVSDAQAAASFLRGVTARVLLKEVAPLQRDDTVLFHAAAGGVGLLFAQWARALGVRVIGTVSSDEKAAAARRAGCVEVIDYMKEDFVARMRDLMGGEGVAAVFDSIGRDTFLKSLEALRPRGVLARLARPRAIRRRSIRSSWRRRRCTSLGQGGTCTRRADSSSRRAPPTCSTPYARAS